MSNIDKALKHLNRKITEREHGLTIPFDEFLRILIGRPREVVRNIFQTFNDMIHNYVDAGMDEYPDDLQSEQQM